MHAMALRCRSGRVGSRFASMTSGLFKTRSSNLPRGAECRASGQ